MQARTVWLPALIGLTAAAGVATLSLTPAQAPVTPSVESPPPRPLSAGVARAATPLAPPAADATPVKPAVATAPADDDAKVPPLTRQFTLAARRGAEWLFRSNLPSGRFRPGWVPALNVPVEGDHFLHQAGATLALARAARFTKDDRHAARAAQAALTLLAETAPDPDDPKARHTLHPSPVVDRVAAAGLVALALYELPGQGDEHVARAEELVRYAARQQRGDGSLRAGDASADDPAALAYAAVALAAAQAGQAAKPAGWKDEVARRALPYCRSAWAARPSSEAAGWLMAAYGAFAARTKDAAADEFVSAVADWSCGLQYTQPDPLHPLWWGGFQGTTADGKPAMTAPRAESARLCEGLLSAARAARALGDAGRADRYRAAAARGLQFVTTLQYTEANAQHFTAEARAGLVGGFHGSPVDGDLRLSDTQAAVCALVGYLTQPAGEGG